MTQPIETPIKLAAYIQTANLGQDSVARQMERARAYWRKNFNNSDLKVYCDEGSSGRPALDRLVADANAGIVDLVMVESLDRFGRSKSALLTLMSRMEQSHVEILCTAEDDPVQAGQAPANFDEALRAAHAKRSQLGRQEARQQRADTERGDV